jgi:hypothetical protein
MNPLVKLRKYKKLSDAEKRTDLNSEKNKFILLKNAY